jgi:hypothetical protein
VGYGEPITLAVISGVALLGSAGIGFAGKSKEVKAAREKMAADAAMQQQMMLAQQQQAQVNAQTAQAQAASQAQTVKYAMFGLGGLVVAGILYKMWSQSDSGEDDASDEE